MNRKFCIFILAILVSIAGLFCGCAQDPVTYASLSEEEQAVVDFIYQNRGVWNSSACGSLSFTDVDGKPCLFTFSLESQQSRYEFCGWRRWYSYNMSAQTIEEYDSKYVFYSGYKPSEGTPIDLTYTPSWDNRWSESEAKDYIAQKYYNYLNGD